MDIGSPKIEVNIIKHQSADSSSGPKAPAALSGVHSLKWVRDLVCRHQGEITQGIFLSLEYHKQLREAMDNEDRTAAKNALLSLESVSERHFTRAWIDTAISLHAFYAARKRTHKNVPRVCLKGTAPNSNGTKIIDVFRGAHVTRSGRSYGVEANVAFDTVKKSGLVYKCSDIPEAVRNGRYKNPRLNPVAASLYANAGRAKQWLRRRREVCDEWGQCWIDYSKDAPMSFYRSTVVVPLTLINNDLDSEFLNTTILGIAREAERTIYGFLCFDHPAVEYFGNESEDIGYIAADLLSFHLMNRYVLIHASKTVKEMSEDLGYRLTDRP